ncbi:nicotinamide riboside transporter PnuC [Nocardioides sp. CPCC 205120]|uniref:nicotinamide riboside transporter PnuC n=1 Tax=Nocardioides sp. CPCC 205120 TaxID=3406462 RepID=UPI003B50075D
MSPLEWLLHGQLAVGGGYLSVPEVVGNAFGLASALLGMRRVVWAWPVGLVGNVLLFGVFAWGELSNVVAEPLWGQAGRQVFFAAVGLYGWWRWSRLRRAGGAADGGAVVPRWAGPSGWLQLAVLGVVGYAAAYAALTHLGSWGPATEAWILAGSMLATYGMARGWVEFWLVWLAVDVVGVTTLLEAGYYPTAAMYVVYAAFVVLGFVTWWRVERRLHALARSEATEPPASAEPLAPTVPAIPVAPAEAAAARSTRP